MALTHSLESVFVCVPNLQGDANTHPPAVGSRQAATTGSNQDCHHSSEKVGELELDRDLVPVFDRTSPADSNAVILIRPVASPKPPITTDDIQVACTDPFSKEPAVGVKQCPLACTSSRRLLVTVPSSVSSDRLSPCTALVSSASANLRREVSLKAALNLSIYDYVPDVDVSEAHQLVDSSDDEDAHSIIQTSGSYGLSYMVDALSANQHGFLLDKPTQDPTTVTAETVQPSNCACSSTRLTPQAGSCRPPAIQSPTVHLGPGSSTQPMASVFADPLQAPSIEPLHAQHTADAHGLQLPVSSCAAEAVRGAGSVTVMEGNVRKSRSQPRHMPSIPGPSPRCSKGGVLSQGDIQRLLKMHQAREQGTLEVAKDKESNVLAASQAMPKAMRRSMLRIQDFSVLKCLHKGYASYVFSAVCNASHMPVVLKVYALEAQSDLVRMQLYREICVHSKLEHKNIAQFYVAFREENCVVIVQEYAAGGDLLKYIDAHGGRLSENAAVQVVLQPCLTALQYLHTQGIVHRDIKPENCLLTENRQLKLTDFGLAVDLKIERANTRAGTLDYMAPEVLGCPTKDRPSDFKAIPNAAHYTTPADTWALGVFAYELIVGKLPFHGDETSDTVRNILKGAKPEFPSPISPAARDFITSCLNRLPSNRLPVQDMLRHPWITMHQNISELNRQPSC